jgi:hypothetical protein
MPKIKTDTKPKAARATKKQTNGKRRAKALPKRQLPVQITIFEYAASIGIRLLPEAVR